MIVFHPPPHRFHSSGDSEFIFIYIIFKLFYILIVILWCGVYNQLCALYRLISILMHTMICTLTTAAASASPGLWSSTLSPDNQGNHNCKEDHHRHNQGITHRLPQRQTTVLYKIYLTL